MQWHKPLRLATQLVRRQLELTIRAKEQRANETLASSFPTLQTYFQACRRASLLSCGLNSSLVRLGDKD